MLFDSRELFYGCLKNKQASHSSWMLKHDSDDYIEQSLQCSSTSRSSPLSFLLKVKRFSSHMWFFLCDISVRSQGCAALYEYEIRIY